MGLGKLINRSTRIDVTNTVTGVSQTYTIVDNLAPDWATDDYRGAMGIPGAWRAAVMLSDILGSLPWHAFREYGGRDIEQITPTPPLLEQPNPPDTRMTSFSSMALDLLWEGNAIALVADRNAQNWPTAAIPVPASQVGVRRVTPDDMSMIPVGELEYSVGNMRLPAWDVIHIKGPCAPGALRGMGILEAHLNTLNLATEQNRQARSLSQHGVPTGLLKATSPDTTPDQMKAAKTAWLTAQRDRTIAALGPTTDFVPLSWNPEELQLIEARKFTLTELELIFGLPVGWLGGQDSSKTYSNIEQDAVNLQKFSLGGHIARFEQALTLQFPRGTVVKANLDALLRADTKTRYEAHEIGIRAGFLTKDEARGLENRPPLTERDEPRPELPEQPADNTGTDPEEGNTP